MSETTATDEPNETTATPAEPNEATSDEVPVRVVAPAETLRGLIEPVESLVSESQVWFRPTGVELRATDPAKAALVGVSAAAETFEAYRASETTVGVDVERLSTVLGLTDNEVTLELDPETRELSVEAGGVCYQTTVLAPERVRDAPERENLESGFGYDARFGLPAAGLTRVVRATSMVADYLTVRSDGQRVAFTSAGDTDECTVSRDETELHDPALGDAESILSLDYLSVVERTVPSEATVRLAAGTETPLAAEYRLPTGGEAEWLISPRVTR